MLTASHSCLPSAILPFSTSFSSFILDSGANACLTGDRSLLGANVETVDVPVEGISGSLRATLVGSSSLVLPSGAVLELSKLFFVPGLARTLLSNSALVEEGYTLTSSKDWPGTNTHGVNITRVTRGSTFIYDVLCTSGLYQDSCRRDVSASSTSLSRRRTALKAVLAGKGMLDARGNPLTFQELMHRRCVHFSWGNKHLADAMAAAFPGVEFSFSSMPVCDACIFSKSCVKHNHGPRTRRATKPLCRVHYDIGFSSTPGLHGEIGFLLAVDEATEKVFVRLLHRKSETFTILTELQQEMERHFASKIGEVNSPYLLASLRSDSSQENRSNVVQDWCKKHGIYHEFSAPYSQWQNGVAERLIGVCWAASEASRKLA